MGKKNISQSQRFIETAKRVGASEDAEVSDRALKKVASAQPPKSVQNRKNKPKAKQRT